MNIMLADHRALIRNAIGSYLSQSLKRDVIEAESYEEAMSRMETDEKFDVVLFEHQLPGINGLEGLESAVKTHPETPFLLLVQDDNRMTIERAMKLGAAGCIPKTLGAPSMLNALRFVASGEKFVPMSVYRSRREVNSDLDLSGREVEVLSLVTKGQSNKEIANSLSITEVTAKSYVRSLNKKLGVRNRTQIAMAARNLQLA